MKETNVSKECDELRQRVVSLEMKQQYLEEEKRNTEKRLNESTLHLETIKESFGSIKSELYTKENDLRQTVAELKTTKESVKEIDQ
jgi:chromosome segregation ATPase